MASFQGQTGINRSTALVQLDFLDPREMADAAMQPFENAVNIPLSRIAALTHALPPGDEIVRIVGTFELANETIALLATLGRTGEYVGPGTHCSSRVHGRLWRPNAYLAERAPLIQTASRDALDIPCGVGRDTVYLASMGWDVYAIDVLADATERAATLYSLHTPVGGHATFRELDLETDVEPAITVAGYDLIICFRYLHRPLFAWIANWLRPGGEFIFETFTTLHRERHGKPSNDAYILQLGEAPTLIRGLEIVHYDESWHGDAHTARIHARKS